MHLLLVIVGGILLFGIFSLFGRLWSGDVAGILVGAKLFLPVWLAIALINMWVGVNKAGYTLAQELTILFVVFAVPAAIAMIAIWHLSRG